MTQTCCWDPWRGSWGCVSWQWVGEAQGSRGLGQRERTRGQGDHGFPEKSNSRDSRLLVLDQAFAWDFHLQGILPSSCSLWWGEAPLSGPPALLLQMQ